MYEILKYRKMNKVHKVLIDELKDIVGHDGQLIELDFEQWPNFVYVAYKQKDMQYARDTMWVYKDKEIQKKDFPIINFIKETFHPLGNVMYCATSYTSCLKNDQDSIIYSKKHGDSEVSTTATNGQFYLSITPSTLNKIKKDYKKNGENSIFELIENELYFTAVED